MSFQKHLQCRAAEGDDLRGMQAVKEALPGANEPVRPEDKPAATCYMPLPIEQPPFERLTLAAVSSAARM